MRSFFVWKNYFILSLIFFLFSLNGCSKVSKDPYFQNSVSLKQNLAEDVFLEDTYLLVSLNRLKTAQNEKLDKVMANFSSFESVKKYFINLLNNQILSLKLDFEKDIKPFMGENSRVNIALAGKKQDEVQNILYSVLSLYVSDEKAYNNFEEKIKNSGLLKEEKYKGEKILVEEKKGDSSLYVWKYKDILFIGNGYDRLIEMIDNNSEGKKVLSGDENFQNAVKDVKNEYLGFVYFDLNEFSKYQGVISKDNEEQKAIAYSLALSAKNNGITFDSTKINEYLKYDSANIDNINIFKNYPGRDMIFYYEGKDLQQKLKVFVESMGQLNKNLAQNYESVKNIFKQLTTRDFETDFLGWMNKDFAFAIQNNGNKVIPGITFVIDGNANKEMAKEFIKRVDAQIDDYIAKLAKESEDLAKAISKESVKIGKSTLTQVQVDLNNLKQKNLRESFPNIPLPLFSENGVFYYGIDEENNVILSTYQRFAKDYKTDVLAEDDDFQKFIKSVSDSFEKEIMYVNTENFLKYAQTYVDFQQKIGVSDNSSMILDLYLSLIKSELKNAKGLIFGNKLENGRVLGNGFMEIEKEVVPVKEEKPF